MPVNYKIGDMNVTENINPSYYAIIPADVRYDERLKPNAKLLYGEITALANKEGYCWATNNYFASLYSVNNSTISKWVSQLHQYKYITVELLFKKNSKEVDKRIIKITPPMGNNEGGYGQKETGGMDKKRQENNTSINNTRKSIVHPSLKEIEEYVREKNYNIDCKKFFEYYSSNDWKDKNNKPVKNWKLKLLVWRRDDTPTNKEFKDYK